MKQLFLVRHGKSDWNHNVTDHQRPVKKRAYHDAEMVANALQKAVSCQFPIYSSTAKRAHTTAELLQGHLKEQITELKTFDDLYVFNSQDLMDFIHKLPDEEEQVMLVSHNGGLTDLINEISDATLDNLPTTGLALIKFEVDNWASVKEGKLILHLFPKNLR
jgi:phosphohistidine phosphatase